jgi:hypothetical protein
MHVGGHRSLPLVDGDQRPLGIVTVNDVIRWLAGIFPEAVLNLRPGEPDRGPRTRTVRGFELVGVLGGYVAITDRHARCLSS